MLLGFDVFFGILEDGRIKSPSSNLIAQNTLFGWIVGGSGTTETREIQTHYTFIDIDKMLRQFWELEDVWQSKKPKMSRRKNLCNVL